MIIMKFIFTAVSNTNFEMLIRKTRLFKYIENFTTKNETFEIKKNSDIFHISAQDIAYEYPQSMFLSRNKKNNVYPLFFCIKMGFKRVKII